MTTETIHTRTGISLTTALTVLFVALKLLGKITWSWVWVVSPLWISALITIGFLLLFFMIMILFLIFGNR